MKPRKWNVTDRVQLLFEPADLWVGVFWDRIKRKLYVLPVPCLGLVIQFRAERPFPGDVYVTRTRLTNTSEVVKESDIGGVADSALFKNGRFPHCDPRVLHAQGECKICDEYAAAAQGARMIKAINLTGHTDADKAPCPADAARGLNGAHRWHGNRPTCTKCGSTAEVVGRFCSMCRDHIAKGDCGNPNCQHA